MADNRAQQNFNEQITDDKKLEEIVRNREEQTEVLKRMLEKIKKINH